MTKYILDNGVKREMTTAEETEGVLSGDALVAVNLSSLRSMRNLLLIETDYMGNSDVTMSDAWKTYRKALRDITDTYGSMSDDGFSFPTKPS
tara:strand:+ start:323 stop:598 length:276 start_codon:yes stop_codon:yes gene_type:complete